MGASTIFHTWAGKETPREAFRYLQQEAERRYGQDPYNGAINNCYLAGEKTGFPRFGTKAFDKWMDDKIYRIDKREVYYIELKGNSEAVKRFKRIHGMKGMRNVRCYYFFGWAPE